MAIKRIGNININYTVPDNQLQMYNALGRSEGMQMANPQAAQQGDNFFVKRGKSIENAVGTTLAAPMAFFKSGIDGIGGAQGSGTENAATQKLLRDSKESMNEVARRYGYNTYHDVWDAREEASKNGDQATLDLIDNTIMPQLSGQADANAEKAKAKRDAFEDYRQNNYVSKKINQDNTKFLGSAINTLSTGLDITGLSATPLTNAAQGAIEGFADELEQNGGNVDITRLFTNGVETKNWDDFDLGRAGQNALIGAASGAVTGMANKGLNNVLAKRGGNLFRGGNALTRGINNLGSKTALGRIGSTLATGAGRGAFSGAVGGATGAGLSAALNNGDILGSAAQGAIQGAKQGAVTGGIMAGANMAISKTPGVGKFYNELQTVKSRWDQSGKNFDERLTNTLTSGESGVGDWLMNRRQSKVLGTAGNIGNRTQDVSDTYRTVDPLGNRKEYTPDQVRKLIDEYENYEAPEVLSSNSTDEVTDAMGEAGVTLSEIFRNRNGGQFNPYSRADGEAFNKWVQQTKADLSTPTTAKGWAKKAGERVVEDVNNKGVGLSVKDMSPLEEIRLRQAYEDGAWKNLSPSDDIRLREALQTKGANNLTPSEDLLLQQALNGNSNQMPDDIRKMQIHDYNMNADGVEQNDRYRDVTPGIDKVRDAFDNSANQQVIAKRGDTEFALGDFGRGNLLRKVDVNHNLSEADIANIISNSDAQSVAGDSSFRKDNIAWFGTTADGDRATVITRPNIYGQQEIINAYKNNPGYETELINQFGTPAQSRTGNSGLEGPGAVSAARSDDSIIPQIEQNVNEAPQYDAWDRVAQQAGYNNYDEVVQRYIEANPNTPLNPRDAAGQILTWLDQNPNTPTTAKGWAKLAGDRALDDINERGIGLGVKDVSQDPRTQVYDQLTNDKTSTSGRLRNAAGLKLMEQYGTIEKPVARATNAPQTLQEIADMGFTKPADVERMSDAITGSNGEVSKLVSNLVATADPVNTFEGEKSGQTLDDFIDLAIDRRGLNGINEGTAVKKQINAIMGSLPSRADGSVSFEDDPTDVFKMTQILDAEAANYEGRSGLNYGTTTPDKLRAAQVIKDVSNLMKDRIYETADVKAALTPEVAENLKAYNPNNEAWARTVDNEIMTANSVKDLRSFQAPWVRARKIIDNGYMNSATYGGRLGNSSTLPLTKRGMIGAALNATINSKPGLRAQAKALNKAADWLDNRAASAPATTAASTASAPATATNSAATQLYNALGRTQGLTSGEQVASQYLSDAAQALNAESGYMPPLGATTSTYGDNTLESLVAPTATSETSVYNALTQTPTSTGYLEPTGDYWTDILATALSNSIDANDVEAFAELYPMYQQALAKNQTSSESNTSQLNATQQAQIAKFDAADSAIDELESLFESAGGGKGPILGNLQSVAGNWGLDSGAKTYNDMAEGLVNQISAAIGKTDSLNTEGEVKRALKLIPQLTDDAQTARNKLEELRRMLATTKASYNTAYGL